MHFLRIHEWRHILPSAVVLLFAFLAAGCSTLLAVRDQQRRAELNAVVAGTVSTEHEARGPLVVALVVGGPDDAQVIDYFVATKPGPWMFAVSAGTYWLAAFEDANGDYRYEDEPAYRVNWDQPLHLGEGTETLGIDLMIPEDDRFDADKYDIEDLVPRGEDQQRRISLFSLGTAGTVTSLDDLRFARENATEGMWKFYDFLLKYEPGIYFLQEYDPAKIPVLFVHGINGSPIEFRGLIEGLDQSRFQPWVFYYPSGAQLEGISEFLAQLFTRLREEHNLTDVVVVAHSMGGLVTRDFLLNDFERNGSKVVKTYVTISSPLAGMPSAGQGVEMSPIVVNAWRGLAPGSEFLEGLFYDDPAAHTIRRRLPAHMDYHMIFGYRGESGDGVVPIGSQLRDEAQSEARSIRGFDEDHSSILHSADVSVHLNKILSRR